MCSRHLDTWLDRSDFHTIDHRQNTIAARHGPSEHGSIGAIMVVGHRTECSLTALITTQGKCHKQSADGLLIAVNIRGLKCDFDCAPRLYAWSRKCDN